MEDKDRNPDEEAKKRKSFEELVDKASDKLTKSISEGIKRMEEAFDRSKENLRESTSISEKYKNLFNYPTGGFLLVVIGFVWFMYTIGFFEVKWFPIILIIIGLYMMLRKRSA